MAPCRILTSKRESEHLQVGNPCKRTEIIIEIYKLFGVWAK
jgi:hypothetical protein